MHACVDFCLVFFAHNFGGVLTPKTPPSYGLGPFVTPTDCLIDLTDLGLVEKKIVNGLTGLFWIRF